MRMRLSGEDEWMLLAPSTQSGYPYHSVEESFWRVADMTGVKVESVTLLVSEITAESPAQSAGKGGGAGQD